MQLGKKKLMQFQYMYYLDAQNI